MHAKTEALPSAFNRLAWSNLAAQSAEQIGLAAAPIIAVMALGAGPGQTGLLQTAQTLPFLLLAIPAGLLADRMMRRRLMAVAEMFRVLSLVGVLALAQLNLLSWWLLALLGMVGACGTVVYGVAAPALVPVLVPQMSLAAANARIELARTAAFAAGPAVAGALVGWAGASPAFGFAAVLSAFAVYLLTGLHEPARPSPARRHPIIDIREGAEFVFKHSLLMPIFLTQVIFSTAFFVIQAVYAPYAVHHIGLSAAEVGATLATYGCGMVVAALFAARIRGTLSFGTIIASGPVAGALSAIIMVLTIWLPSLWLAGASFFLLGAGGVVWVISTTTLRQTVTPPELLGRVSAINITAYGARPIGSAIGAFVGGVYGSETCLFVAAIGFSIQAAIILASPIPRLAKWDGRPGL